MNLVEKIQGLLRSGHIREAKNLLDQEQTEGSRRAQTLTLLALTYFKIGEVAKSLEYVLLALDARGVSDDIYPLAYRILGDIHLLQGDTDKSVVAYFQGLVHEPYNKELMSRAKSAHDLQYRNSIMEFYPIKGMRDYLEDGNGTLIEAHPELSFTSMKAPYVAELGHIQAVGQSSALFSSDMTYLVDDEDYANTDRSDIVSTTMSRVVLGFKRAEGADKQDRVLATMMNRPAQLEECIVLNSRASDNYYHFLIEVVPKWMLIEPHAEYEDMPILVNGHMPEQHYAILEALVGNKRRIIKADSSARYAIGRAIVPSKLSDICFDLLPGFEMESTDFCYSDAAIKFLKNRFRNRKNTELTRQIYLSRRSSQLKKRHILNQEEVESYFSKNGFEIVDTAELDFTQQIELFSSAKIVAGATGASFTNLLFCQEECSIILIANADKNVGVCFRNLAHACGISSFFDVPGYCDSTETEGANQADFRVRLEDIALIFSKLGIQ